MRPIVEDQMPQPYYALQCHKKKAREVKVMATALVICSRRTLLNNIQAGLGMGHDEEGRNRNVSGLCHS